MKFELRSKWEMTCLKLVFLTNLSSDIMCSGQKVHLLDSGLSVDAGVAHSYQENSKLRMYNINIHCNVLKRRVETYLAA